MQSIAKFLYIIFVSFIFRTTTLSERNSRLTEFFFWQLCDRAVPTLLTTAINLKHMRFHKLHTKSVGVQVTCPTNSDSESDSHGPMQALTTVAEISHTLDTLHKIVIFPAGPLERDPHSSTPHLAYNAQNNVVYAYENALAELLTKLDGVEPWI